MLIAGIINRFLAVFDPTRRGEKRCSKGMQVLSWFKGGLWLWASRLLDRFNNRFASAGRDIKAG
jgi:hypothetical protein